ncbi:lysis protein [Pseudomonas sp. 5P_5.1_Bac1]|uniref:lysis protein n=1 Tax=Pseudomonas sp. 5P_5.1_Bac1 TaxID=2971616 RepID=UPI0021C7B25B|nr:lysis protein [Pseudomonas sp. 5P_5.1_Bac1]MCU1722445.1 lysis protein [Pseudomonas sp. 5P_5.1_Bac1]
MILPDWRLPAVSLLLGLGLGGGGAWQWQANAYELRLAKQTDDFQRERLAAALAVVDWNNVEQDKRTALESRLQASDQTHTRELQNAQTAQARLRDRLATADLRLSVILANPAPPGSGGLPAAAGTCSVVHGATRAQLDPAHAQRIVGITDDGNQGLIALKACQAYVREIAR